MEGCFIFTTNQPTNGKSESFSFGYIEKEKLLPKHSISLVPPLTKFIRRTSFIMVYQLLFLLE